MSISQAYLLAMLILLWPLAVGSQELAKGLGMYTYSDAMKQQAYQEWVKAHGNAKAVFCAVLIVILIGFEVFMLSELIKVYL